MNSEFLQLSKELQVLAKKTPLNWGKVQNNTTDNKINMFKCTTLNSLEYKIKDLSNQDKNYFIRRWFLWKCSQVDEYLFYKEENVKRNPNHKDQSWDIEFNNTMCFDVKGTVAPKSLRKDFVINDDYENELINFYYKNQSKGIRNHLQNRLFIVHHSFLKNERNLYLRCYWELKKKAYQEFNQLITSKLKLIKHKSVFAKCIFIIENESNNFSYKII